MQPFWDSGLVYVTRTYVWKTNSCQWIKVNVGIGISLCINIFKATLDTENEVNVTTCNLFIKRLRKWSSLYNINKEQTQTRMFIWIHLNTQKLVQYVTRVISARIKCAPKMHWLLYSMTHWLHLLTSTITVFNVTENVIIWCYGWLSLSTIVANLVSITTTKP